MRALEIRRLDAARVPDFERVLACDAGAERCACVAWHVDTWRGFGRRTPEENRALRDAVFARGLHDGYLAYAEDAPVGWCQVAPCVELPKARLDLGDALDTLGPETWAIACFSIPPRERRRGVARALLAGVLADLPGRGAARVVAFPKRGSDDPAELWNGPEAMFRGAGFRVLREDPERPILVREFDAR